MVDKNRLDPGKEGDKSGEGVSKRPIDLFSTKEGVGEEQTCTSLRTQ